VAGTTTLTLPAATDTLVGKATTDTLTNKTLTAPTLASANITTALTLTGASGTSGQVLTSAGTGAAPTWTTVSASQWTTTGSDIYYTTGKVGIGTATPAYNLDVARSGNGVSARFSQGSFFSYIFSSSAASYFTADTGGLTSYGVTASTLQMSAGNGADQLVVSQTSVKPNVLLDISGASAGQIKFPATQSASSDANTLDDYEEGTWTPSLGGTATYSDRQGNYTKVGRIVTLWGSMTVTLIGTGSTTTMSGLPFTSTGQFAGAPFYFSGLSQAVTRIALFTSSTNLRNSSSASSETTATVDLIIFQNNTRIDFSITYMATA
jgi:hypothetical protein